MTPYEVLGVDPHAPAEEVRRAYLSHARRCHPDYFVAAPAAERVEADRRMRALNQAWAVLGDDRRRRAYDAARGRGGPAPRPFEPFEAEDDFDPHDIVERPYRDRRATVLGRRRSLTLAPVLLFAGSVILFCLSLVLSSSPLFVASVIAFLMACAGFVVVPLLALSDATRDEG